MNVPIQYDPIARETIQQELELKVKEKSKKKQEREALKQRKIESGSSSLRIAVTTRGNARVNLHFGHAKEFLVFDVKEKEIKFVGVRKVQSYCVGKVGCNTKQVPILAETAEILKDCQMLISSGIGKAPQKYLQDRGIVSIIQSGNIEELLYESSKYYKYMNHTSVEYV